jgi:hypothetical protein
LNDEIEKKSQKNLSQSRLTYQTRDIRYETKIPRKKQIKINYEAQFSTNSMSKNEIKNKLNYKRKKNDSSHPGLTYQTLNPSHKTKIIS